MRGNKPSLRIKANITIATLNLNGYMAPSCNMTGIDKWPAINHTINKYHIAILALQETHLDLTRLQDVTSCFEKRLEIIISQHPDNPRTTAGIAFVINKALINPKEYQMYELQPGLAAALKIRWLEDEELTQLNVYAPNVREEKAAFWETIDIRRRALNLDVQSSCWETSM